MPNSDGPKLGDSTTMMLIAAGRVAQRRFESALANQHLTLRHIGAIGHLAHTPDLSYSDLARRARVTPQSMHATIGQLVELGAVTTETRGRATILQLTAHGHELLALAADAAYACDELLDVDSGVLAKLLAELRKTAMQPLSAET
jgi:DNA-binding MarR family transcriptional regulator